jgi:C1A family cysteine protease
MNGPCVAGLYVRDPDADDFWNGSSNYGGHAVAIVGYNKKGFIIRNSWGTSYGEDGYAILKYEDFNKIIECWTIVD